MSEEVGRRRLIREGVVTQLREGGLRTRVFTGRQQDERENVDEYIEVYLARGNSDSNGNLLLESTDTLVLAIKITGQPTDDDLDKLGDAAERALFQDDTLGGIVGGIVPLEYEYPDDSDRKYDSLLLSYVISNNTQKSRITEI